MPDIYAAQAEDDFSRARVRELLSRISTMLDPDRRKLLSLNDVRSVLKPSGESYKGMQVVQLDRIVGSEGRYRDFAQGFLPRFDHLKTRWMRVDMAHYQDITLPPITLYEIGGAYFVRDGNHRVSVARMQGSFAIDAEVVSLSSEIPLAPDMTIEDLKKAVIGFEKSVFYRETRMLELTGYADLDFTAPGQYDVVMNHILVHKYYLNERQEKEIPLDDAILSWWRTVYEPIRAIIAEERILWRFPDRTVSDLYVYVVKHWDQLKRKYGIPVPLESAAKDFSARYGKDLPARLREVFRKILKRE